MSLKATVVSLSDDFQDNVAEAKYGTQVNQVLHVFFASLLTPIVIGLGRVSVITCVEYIVSLCIPLM